MESDAARGEVPAEATNTNPVETTACHERTLPTGLSEADEPTAPLDSRRLFGGRSEVLIRHAGQIYRLRITRTGKLILNK